MPKRHLRTCTLALSLAGGVPPVCADELADGKLAEMSIEQLGDVIITSVSRQQQRLGGAAASIFIIHADDIHRSGARTLPEALRLAPNLQVARVDARNYAVTARGFNNPFENKLLVLVDGRSIYTPLFSGVFWDAQDVVMEDVERIEVISGPGATIWGANAVNGVINVITRAARDSQGGLAVAAAGKQGADGTLRYGGRLDNGGHYRVYGRSMQQDATPTAAGLDSETGMRRRQAGFRADLAVAQGEVTLSGDAYQGALGQFGTRDIWISGANLVSRYTRKLGENADLRLQLVLDHTERNQPNAFVERLDTFELEAQHGVRLGRRHHLVWGGGYRHSRDNAASGPLFGFLPNKLLMHWGNVFAQDDIALTPDLRLTAGVKVEHNNYTGAEVLPNLRLAWNADARRLLWGSLARTVRTPSRIDRDLYLPATPIVIAGAPYHVIGGGPSFVSEVANVAELGYRAQPTANLSYAVTAFYSEYDKLRTQEPLPVFGIEFRNLGQARTRGLEMWGSWRAAANWRLHAGLVAQSIDIRTKAGSRDATAATGGLNTNDPNTHWMLRSSHELSQRHRLDLTLRHVGKLRTPAVRAYSELDLQWLWTPQAQLEVALGGQNLLHRRHLEFGVAPNGNVIERSAALKLTWRF